MTTAIGSLERRGLLERRADGAWLLLGPPPTALEALPAGESPWRDARSGDPAVSRIGLDTQPPPLAPAAPAPPLERRARAADAIARSQALVDASQALVARLHRTDN